jgi:recombinational DNA repair ATPase RecF
VSITSLKLKNFRCFCNIEFNFEKKIILIEGDNGSGKTTLLESLYYACYLKSFRTNSNGELVNFENKVFFLRVDFIKLDVEGAEMNVVKGAINAINKFRPQMAISIYHNKNDLFEIIEFLNKNFENYLFKLAHYSPTIFETILYAIPEEKYEAT